MPWCPHCYKYHERLTTGCSVPLFVPASSTQATFTPADAESARSSELAACRSRVAELERQLAGFERTYETQTAAIVEWEAEVKRLREALAACATGLRQAKDRLMTIGIVSGQPKSPRVIGAIDVALNKVAALEDAGGCKSVSRPATAKQRIPPEDYEHKRYGTAALEETDHE